MFKRGGYGEKVKYRLGFWPRLKPKSSKIKRVWIQAVSVGEISSIQHLMQFFINDPSFEIVLSGTTSTGLSIAKKKYSNDVIAFGPFPLDWYPFSSFCWSRINPDILICVDSELWPEHMQQAKKRGVSCFIVNARLSDRSFSRLCILEMFKNLILPSNLHIFATSQKQRDRWVQVGIPLKRAENMGNLKIDIAPLNPLTETDKAKYKDELGFPESSVILVGISTWLGEEKFLLETLQMLRDRNIDARLLLIPRHAERRSEIIKEISSHSFSYQQRTRFDKNDCNAHVYLADTTGELNQLIQSADLAFLGKTLPPRHEGQNPIEPVSIGLPLVIGPRCTNFSEICDELVQKRAVSQGNSKLEIMNILIELAQSKKEREKMRKNGLQWRQEQQSPSRKTFAEIKQLSVQ